MRKFSIYIDGVRVENRETYEVKYCEEVVIEELHYDEDGDVTHDEKVYERLVTNNGFIIDADYDDYAIEFSNGTSDFDNKLYDSVEEAIDVLINRYAENSVNFKTWINE